MSQPKPTKEQEQALKNVLEDEEVAEYVGLKGKIRNSTYFKHSQIDYGDFLQHVPHGVLPNARKEHQSLEIPHQFYL